MEICPYPTNTPPLYFPFTIYSQTQTQDPLRRRAVNNERFPRAYTELVTNCNDPNAGQIIHKFT